MPARISPDAGTRQLHRAVAETIDREIPAQGEGAGRATARDPVVVMTGPPYEVNYTFRSDRTASPLNRAAMFTGQAANASTFSCAVLVEADSLCRSGQDRFQVVRLDPEPARGQLRRMASGFPPGQACRPARRPTCRSVSHAAVDIEDVAGDVGGLIRCDEDDRVGEVLRQAEATQRDMPHRGRPPL